MKELNTTAYTVEAGHGYEYRKFVVFPAIGATFASSGVALSVGIAEGIAAVAAVGIASVASFIGLSRKSAAADADTINGVLENVFATDVRIDRKTAKEVAGGLSAVLDDGDGGYYEVEFSDKNEKHVNGDFLVTHVPGDMGLADFDSIMKAMNNPDVKAVLAKLDDGTENVRRLKRLMSKDAT